MLQGQVLFNKYANKETLNMVIGILVTRDTYKEHVVGITKAAINRGHGVMIFLMDRGVLLVKDREVTDLKKLPGVLSFSLCDLNLKRFGISETVVPEGIICGSQYNNAVMNHEADKVILL